MEQLICEKFDTSKINGHMELHEIILAQFGVDWENLSERISVSDLYMPEAEQDKMRDWIIDHWKKWPSHATKAMKRKEMAWMVLDIFPSHVRRTANGSQS